MNDKHRELLAKHFHAKVETSRKWYTAYRDTTEPFSYGLYSGEIRVTKDPYVEISLPLHAAAMLCDMLDMIINHPDNTMGGMTGPMFQYAENVMHRQAMEMGIREGNPTVQDLYEQYQTALKLCS